MPIGRKEGKRKMYNRQEASHDFWEEFFIGRYLIPTDDIRQSSDEIAYKYIRKMKNHCSIPPILVAFSDGVVPLEFADKEVQVSNIEKLDTPVFVLDGHHRYYAHLNQPDYPLSAIFVNIMPDKLDISQLYDHLDGYEWAKKLKEI